MIIHMNSKIFSQEYTYITMSLEILWTSRDLPIESAVLTVIKLKSQWKIFILKYLRCCKELL